MALPIDLWLIHPKAELCDEFAAEFDWLAHADKDLLEVKQ